MGLPCSLAGKGPLLKTFSQETWEDSMRLTAQQEVFEDCMDDFNLVARKSKYPASSESVSLARVTQAMVVLRAELLGSCGVRADP